MRHGIVILPNQSWEVALQRWQGAEERGFDHAWTFDHLLWGSYRHKPWYSSLPLLTAAAVATSHIRLGTLVASPNFRHPLPFAKEVMTIDDISGGRFICGIGAGAAAGFDNGVFGTGCLPPKKRLDRFAEFVELLDRLLRVSETSYAGSYYTVTDAGMYPGCHQQPRVPFAISAAGSRSMKLAATYSDNWITTGLSNSSESKNFTDTIPTLATQMRNFTRLCRELGREPETIDRTILIGQQMLGVMQSKDSFETARGMLAEIGFTDMIIMWPTPDSPFEGTDAQLDAITELL